MDQATQMRCPRCGAILHCGENVCPYCGDLAMCGEMPNSSDSVPRQYNAAQGYGQQAAEGQPPEFRQNFQQPYPPQYMPPQYTPPQWNSGVGGYSSPSYGKAKKSGLVIGIILGVIAAVASCFIVLSLSGAFKVKYSKGHIQNDSYINEWANISLKFPDGYNVAPSDYYGVFEADDPTDCGLYLIDDENRIFAIMYTEPFADKSQTDLLDETVGYVSDALRQEMSNDFDIKCEVRDDYRDISIAGKNFKAADLIVESPTAQCVESLYVTKVDDRFFYIIALNLTIEENDRLVSQIQELD